MKTVLQFLFWCLVMALTALLIWNSRGYLSNPETVAFFRERVPAAPPGWSRVLVAHVVSGMCCLLTGPLLFLPLPGCFRLHIVAGVIYAGSTLVIMLPTGLWLSFSAHGGTVGRAGFLVTGLYMMFAILHGLRMLRQRRMQAHRRWMLRSFALASSALTFRLVYVAGFMAGLDYELNYPLSTWLSTLLNLLLAELIIRLSSKPQPSGEFSHEKKNLPVSDPVPVVCSDGSAPFRIPGT